MTGNMGGLTWSKSAIETTTDFRKKTQLARMADIRCLIAPERILSDVCGVIPDSFQGATHKNQVQVTLHEFRVRSRSDCQSLTETGR
jgi:hypothetical protein